MPVTMMTVANFAEDGADALPHYVEGVLPLLEEVEAINGYLPTIYLEDQTRIVNYRYKI